MEFKGTKGKWKVVEDDDCHSVVLIEQGWSFGRTYIAREICQGHDNWIADATLIAHAPELLDMLRYIYEETNFQSHFPTTSIKVKDLLTRATTI